MLGGILKMHYAVVRHLLQAHAGHDHGHDDEHDHTDEGEETLTVRLIALFTILLCGCLGGLIPILAARARSLDSPFARITRAFSGGVILALALVHIVPESLHMTESLIPLSQNHHGAYPIGGVMILAGILLMYFTEEVLSNVLHHDHNCIRTPSVSHASSLKDPPVTLETPSSHTHECSNPALRTWSQAPISSNWKSQSTAYSMELGCVFHSVLIGLGLGVIVNDRHQAIALTIALCFHQFLEGVSLGSIMILGFSLWKSALMVLAYAVTAPLGIAIGIAVSSSYNTHGTTAAAVEGTLNGISAGMLLFVAMHQLIGEELTHVEGEKQRTRVFLFMGIVLGALSMCILAIWA